MARDGPRYYCPEASCSHLRLEACFLKPSSAASAALLVVYESWSMCLQIYTDAALAKLKLRWRTALIVRELEEEIEALAEGRVHRNKLKVRSCT